MERSFGGEWHACEVGREMRLPCIRLLTKSQAASYCGLSPVTFGGTCPVRPIALGEGVRLHRYDVHDIDKWIDSFRGPAEEKGNSLAMMMLHRLDQPSDLDDKYIRILRYMRDHPDCDTAADIRGAGERTLDILMEKKVISHVGDDEVGRRRFALTTTGMAELTKMDAWKRNTK